MRRWILVTGASLALAVTVVVGRPLPALRGAGEAQAAVCDAKAKPANLNFVLTDMTGRTVRLADYKGKVILLDFWATWCAPCKVEIPWFVEFQNKYRQRGLVVLGVSTDDSNDALKPFAREFKINYPIFDGRDREDVQEAFGPIWGLPTTVLISRDGRICRRHIGFSQKERFEREIEALLGS